MALTRARSCPSRVRRRSASCAQSRTPIAGNFRVGGRTGRPVA